MATNISNIIVLLSVDFAINIHTQEKYQYSNQSSEYPWVVITRAIILHSSHMTCYKIV